jgi:NitT/TauT family transport system substrate-binding protein
MKIVVLALVIAPWVGTVCAATLTAAESNHYFGNLPSYAAIAGGMLKERDIDLKITTMRGGPAAASALISHDVDLLTVSADQAVKMRARNQDVKIVASLTQRAEYAVIVPKESKIFTIEDLKGKTIGVTATGSSTDVGTRSWIIAAGLDPDVDFRLVGLGSSANVLVAFQHGQVAAATMSSPPLLRALGEARVLADFRDFPYQELCVVVRAVDLAGPRRELLKNFVQGIVAAEAKLDADDDFALSVAKASFPELPDDLLRAMVLDGIHLYHSFPAGGEISRESIDNVVAAQMRTKGIAQPVSYEDVVDSSLLK